MSSPLLYIAAPYRSPNAYQLTYNISQARDMAQYYWLQGFIVICPHLNTANFDGLVPDEVFLKGTQELLKLCTHIALHPAWTKSSGSVMEYNIALKRRMIIHYTNMDRVYKKLEEARKNE